MFDPKIKILIVDDMTTMRKMVIKACMSIGFSEFVEAADGSAGWEALSNDPSIGIIISDWNMPNCTGLDLLKRVRITAKYKKLPFVLVTAESEKHQIIEAIQAGCSGYVIKPFTPETLSEKLEEAHKRFTKD
jgi:two-component system chemotaxis response regulator CheY